MVNSDNDAPAKEEDRMFRGMTFWLSSSLPKSVADDIKSHGGRVVKVRKNAQFPIVDPKNTTKTTGNNENLSWQWIIDSLNSGELLDSAEYLVDRTERSSVQALSSPDRGRSIRVAFTKQDDMLVTRWVMQQELKYESMGGNVVWWEMGHMYPHHPWQSWKHRWRKTLQGRPRPRLTEEQINAPFPNLLEGGSEVFTSSSSRDPEAVQNLSPSLLSTQSQRAPNSTGNENFQESPSKEGQNLTANKSSRSTPSQRPRGSMGNESSQQAPNEEGEDWMANKSSQSTQASQQLVLHLPYGFTDKKEFYREYRMFSDMETQLRNLHVGSTIEGLHIEYWDVWKTVLDQGIDNVNFDWDQVADDLGYDLEKRPDVGRKLYEFWEERLALFQREIWEYMNKPHDESGDAASEIPSQELESQDPESHDPELSIDPMDVSQESSSLFAPQNPQSAKRPRNSLSSDQIQAESSTKRARYRLDSRGSPELHTSDANLPSEMCGRLFETPQQEKGKELASEAAVSATPASRNRAEIDVSRVSISPSQQLHDELAEKSPRTSLSAKRSPAALRGQRPADSGEVEQDEDEVEVEVEVEEPTPNTTLRRKLNSLVSAPSAAVAAKPSANSRPTKTQLKPSLARLAAKRKSSTPRRSSAKKQAPQKPMSQIDRLHLVVDSYVMLGYTKPIVRMALETTSWERNLAVEVMKLLHRGASLPSNWEGVWTLRDDQALQEADLEEPPRDEAERAKRKKGWNRILHKHGEELVQLRRKWFAVRAEIDGGDAAMATATAAGRSPHAR